MITFMPPPAHLVHPPLPPKLDALPIPYMEFTYPLRGSILAGPVAIFECADFSWSNAVQLLSLSDHG